MKVAEEYGVDRRNYKPPVRRKRTRVYTIEETMYDIMGILREFLSASSVVCAFFLFEYTYVIGIVEKFLYNLILCMG
ncbi:hypothetical protein BK739_07200 [Bacillus thuringiensis serovar pirenaica]|nr:hypothetical protein BK739_07200 [Bacillus thuringiensis serovar pirenaica]